MAHWFGAQHHVTSATKARKHSPVMTSPTRIPLPKTKKKFFSIVTRGRVESAEVLKSALAQSAGELWSCKVEERLAKNVKQAWL